MHNGTQQNYTQQNDTQHNNNQHNDTWITKLSITNPKHKNT
jgi:hypothetical protein